ncbi:hypothetical protein ASPZODRAFT_136971 [Penicilliopsis zonata CBS 506.65]|uniref:Uncharacterized protein n=1 Tax=Penicilliopsis zonata CBS 506.65 TaxID=1073090 RepID=A0A1L9S6T6_9EURO|nr:hypothetical protein ASPZODRAFT_136971 [Penicilliopsis zonata CBS 506.65]OJJ42835.1 hypothetical protein ASPZODRAFT_136971 [Penicilliopsis zonata CBS 506.65]
MILCGGSGELHRPPASQAGLNPEKSDRVSSSSSLRVRRIPGSGSVEPSFVLRVDSCLPLPAPSTILVFPRSANTLSSSPPPPPPPAYDLHSLTTITTITTAPNPSSASQ